MRSLENIFLLHKPVKAPVEGRRWTTLKLNIVQSDKIFCQTTPNSPPLPPPLNRVSKYAPSVVGRDRGRAGAGRVPHRLLHRAHRSPSLRYKEQSWTRSEYTVHICNVCKTWELTCTLFFAGMCTIFILIKIYKLDTIKWKPSKRSINLRIFHVMYFLLTLL